MNNAGEAVNPSPAGLPVARKGGRKKGWSYFRTRSEAEGELRTIVNLVKLGQIEPARANSADLRPIDLSQFEESRRRPVRPPLVRGGIFAIGSSRISRPRSRWS
jgi:hypothetical protein